MNPELAYAEAEVDEGLPTVPEHLRDGLKAHCLYGRTVGQFLSACLSNDLTEAVGRADDVSLPALKSIVQFLFNFAPGGCWGSPAQVSAWRARGGIAGLPETASPR